MRTATTIRIALWTLVAVILVGLLVAGIRGDLPFVGINIGTAFHYKDSELYEVGGGTAEASEVNEIEVNWISGKIKIEPYEGNVIVFEETGQKALSEKERMRYYLNNGKLIIQFQAPNRGINILNNISKDLTIRVPEEFALDMLDVETVSGEIRGEGFSARKVDVDGISNRVNLDDILSTDISIESVSGNVVCTGIQVDKIDVESISGAISLMGILEEVECNSTSGKISIEPGLDVRRIDAESISGSITVLIPENEGFKVNYSSISGKFYCDFPASISSEQAVYKDGKAIFDIETLSGAIRIEEAAI